jgi:Domain of unknown function (DUF4185)
MLPLLCIIASMAAAPAHGFRVSSAVPDDTLQEFFQARETGWLGADVATSIPLENGRYLWLFGDTLLGNSTPAGDRRLDGRMPRNSVALAELKKEHGTLGNATLAHPLRFSWSFSERYPDHGGFFTPTNTSEWLWATQAVPLRTSGDVIVLAMVVFSTPPQQENPRKPGPIESVGPLSPRPAAAAEKVGGPLGFGFSGTVAIRVRGGLRIPPSQWHEDGGARIEVSAIPTSNATLLLGTTAATLDRTGTAAYLFGAPQPATSGSVVARIDLKDLGDFRWERMQYLGSDGSWVATSAAEGWRLPALKPLFMGTSETSVAWNPFLQRYIAFTLKFLDTKIGMATAPAVEGPWADPIPVYDIPAPWNEPPTFCYAPKYHPEFGTADGSTFVLSFMSNTPNVTKLETEPKVPCTLKNPAICLCAIPPFLYVCLVWISSIFFRVYPDACFATPVFCHRSTSPR